MLILPALSLLLIVGVMGRPAGDLLAGREFLAVYMRQSRSQVPSYITENDLEQHSRSSSAVTRTPTHHLAQPIKLAQQEAFTTLSSHDGGVLTTSLIEDGQTTTYPPEEQSTEPPETSQVVAVSVSSSVVRQRPVYTLATQEEPTIAAAIQRSHFSVDEGSLTIHKEGLSSSLDSRFTVERSQDGEKTSLLVRQSNGEASSHFSIRQSHPPDLVQQSLQHQRQLSQHQELISRHQQQVEQHRQHLQKQHDEAVKQHEDEIKRQQEAESQQKQNVETMTESSTSPPVTQVITLDNGEAHISDTTTSQINSSPEINAAEAEKFEIVENKERVAEDRREERTSFSVARTREDKSFNPYPKRVDPQKSGGQIKNPWPSYRSTDFGESEKNYEVDEAVSVQTNGRAYGVQSPRPQSNVHPATPGNPPVKSGYVVEGQNYRKYRVEEKTPDGFIVGEYGVVSHDDGSLRGVRYTADSNINPRLIYDALVKFLSLK